MNGQPIAVSGLPGQPHNGRRMYYVLVDQMLVRTGKIDTDGLIVFGGAVHTDYATSPLENQVFGGVVSTAGGLVFFCDESGALAAADAKSGQLLWHFHANVQWHASPMTYAVDGKQFVAVAAGSNIISLALP